MGNEPRRFANTRLAFTKGGKIGVGVGGNLKIAGIGGVAGSEPPYLNHQAATA